MLIVAAMLLLPSTSTYSACSLDCSKIGGFVCLGQSLLANSAQIVHTLSGKMLERFGVCHFEERTGTAFRTRMGQTPLPSDLPALGITIVECDRLDDEENWKEKSVINRRKWTIGECTPDFSLLLIVYATRLRVFLLQTAPRLIRTDDDFEVTLNGQYTLASLDGLLDELLSLMDKNRAEARIHEADQHLVTEAKEHWPNWAIYVVIICILLTALAFFLGTCITKRTPPLRFKSSSGNQQQQGANRVVDNRRNWGAGFSGGLWAAA